MDRKYEYVGLDIRDKVHNEVFKYIFSIGNHYYNDYEDLKDLIKNILDLGDNKDIELMINSITDLNLYPIEKRNYLASQGFNKRVFDFVIRLVYQFSDFAQFFHIYLQIYFSLLSSARAVTVLYAGVGKRDCRRALYARHGARHYARVVPALYFDFAVGLVYQVHRALRFKNGLRRSQRHAERYRLSG